jgi:hypothetical protein
MSFLKGVISLGLSGGVAGAGTRNWGREFGRGEWRDGDAFGALALFGPGLKRYCRKTPWAWPKSRQVAGSRCFKNPI